MYFAYHDTTILNELTNLMVMHANMFVLLVLSRFLGLCNSTIVVTIHVQRIGRALNHTKIHEEIPHPNSFLCCLRGSNILSLCCRRRHSLLLGTFPAHSTSVYNKHVSGLRTRIIRVGEITRICLTLYTKFIFTTINQEHILSPSQVL